MTAPLLHRARRMRAEATGAERALRRELRASRLAEFRFRRQQPLGNYIVDFVCFESKLVIEIDGGQHDEQRNYDARRDAWLAEQGFRVLRFWNNEVMGNLEGVMETILAALSPSPQPWARFAQLARSGGGKQCFPKPRLHPAIEGEGERQQCPPS